MCSTSAKNTEDFNYNSVALIHIKLIARCDIEHEQPLKL